MSEELINQTDEHLNRSGSQPSAAERLRITREALGLSREDVAAELRLNSRLIAALEENDRGQLPAAAFIGGYLRAYTKLLGLPADQIVAEYLNEGVTPSSYRSTDRSGALMVSSSDPKFRMITFSVIGALVALFAIWWVNDQYAFVTAPQGAHGADAGMEQERVAETPLTVPGVQDTLQGEGSSSDSREAESASDNSSVMNMGGSSSSTPAKPDTTAEGAATITESLPIPPPSAVVISEPLAATVPQSILRLEYQAASWTQVEDAQGRILVYELVKPGRRMELRGVSPFKVNLGYAPGVIVYYNGALFSHANYHRGDMARFNVGAEQDNKPLGR